MLRITVLIVSLLALIQAYVNEQVSLWLCYYLLLINVITFISYAFDKSAARKGNWRVTELTLHLLSFAGGWWGALLAQQLLRHKSIKKKFLVMFSLTLMLNIGFMITLFRFSI